MYEYKAKVLNVVDGDTVDFMVDLGFHTFVKIRARLVGVNTPERGDKNWAKATNMLSQLLTEKGESFIIKTKKDKTEKYGRWLVEIDGVNDKISQVWPWKQ